MSNVQYGDYQFEIYFDGLEGRVPKYPVDYPSLERAAAEVLPSFASDTILIVLFILGLGGIGGYAIWERVTDHPMTPPRLSMNRDFVGLNVATLLIYAGLSIMFFLLPFDLIDRRGLSPTSAGLAFLPFTLAVGLLSPYFGSL